MAQQILSISQLNEYMKGLIDSDQHLSNIAVRGEISNYKLYPSGHHYFTLKDEGSALKCVIFKGNAVRIRFRPENGMKIIAIGRISVYPRDGAYQLYCTAMSVDGVGDLHAAFEQLKNKLSAQGLFDPSRKKQIPKFPNSIGIITSSAGAAVHDMLRVINKRFPISKVKILPVRVQGEEAPPEIASAISYANRFKIADVLIVGRGGGSIEDLWAFNDERVAYAIYNSEIPVISAVGHEPDVTISDYVADLRAATPSNAAELVVPDLKAIQQYLDQSGSAMAASLNRQLFAYKRQLHLLANSPALQNPMNYFTQRRERCETLRQRLTAAQTRQLQLMRNRYIGLAAKLDAMSPLKVLTRGYSLVLTETNNIVSKINQIHTGDSVAVQVSDGKFHATVYEVEEKNHE